MRDGACWDYVVVGSGLTGATIARILHDSGWRVLVVERRSHVGGNVHDFVHPSGIRIHTYGPHYFRTSSDTIWAFVRRFSAFYPYEARLKTLVDGRHEDWPVSAAYIARALSEGWRPEFCGVPANFEEASLQMMPRLVYEKFVRSYSEKQWGVPARQLSAALARRFDVRKDGDDRLSRHKHQGLPQDGYAAWLSSMLAGIPVVLNTDYNAHSGAFRHARRLVYTGAIDEFFGYQFGRLAYRGQIREHEYLANVDHYQPFAQVNNPDPGPGPHIRCLEWKRMMEPAYASRISGTLVTRETPTTPVDPNDCEYPFPNAANQALYERYRSLAAERPDMLICGRLGEYRYYDMDQAIARAMHTARQLLTSVASPRWPRSSTNRRRDESADADIERDGRDVYS